MKAKSIAAVVLAVGLCAVSAWGQSGTVTSANRVGYVKVTVAAGDLVMCGLNFTDAATPTINEVFKDQLTGHSLLPTLSDNIIMWDPIAQGYVTYWKKSTDLQWYRLGEGSATDDPIDSGEGFWIKSNQPFSQDLYLLGTVVDEPVSVMLYAGLNFVAYPYSASQLLNSASLKDIAAGHSLLPTLADQVIWWNESLGRYETYWFKTGSPSQWVKLYEEGSPATFELKIGKGFWYKRFGATVPWSETKPY
ncbi:MAG: hypothetical protein JXR37_37535 [Kiritimatiellae bacterium]|nr:hypothetical protein [Kiritimatiellia bacterium]